MPRWVCTAWVGLLLRDESHLGLYRSFFFFFFLLLRFTLGGFFFSLISVFCFVFLRSSIGLQKKSVRT